jgi:hypothetical protein
MWLHSPLFIERMLQRYERIILFIKSKLNYEKNPI